MRSNAIGKKFMHLVFALMLAAGLAGCGASDSTGIPSTSGTGPGGSSGGTSPSTPSTPTTPTTSTGVPTVTLTVASTTATVSSVGTGGAVLTITVRDANGLLSAGRTVGLVATMGTPSGVTDNGDGTYTATVTSTNVGSASIAATAMGVTSNTESVTFVAGDPDSITLAVDKSIIMSNGADESNLTVSMTDAHGNPANGTADVTLTITAGTGSLTASTLTLSDGTAQSTLVSSTVGNITVDADYAGAGGPLNASVLIVVSDSATAAGEPSRIVVNSVTPSDIDVKDTGGTSNSVISITVLDSNGTPITDPSVSNLEVQILSGPNGGENISGAIVGQVVSLQTSGGSATFNLASGLLPGTVRIRVSVTTDSNGTLLPTPITQDITGITINSGPPYAMSLQRYHKIDDNEDGTYSQVFSSLVTDQWGNMVADDTAIFFGQMGNILLWGDDNPATTDDLGVGGTLSADGTTFTAPGLGNILAPGDTVVLAEYGTGIFYRGGYPVASVTAPDSVTFATTVNNASGMQLNNVDFFAGNNWGGSIFQTSINTTTDGKATTINTYPAYTGCSGVQIGSKVVYWVQTVGGTLGEILVNVNPGIAPAILSSNVGSTLLPATTYSLWLQVNDSGGTPGAPVNDLTVGVGVTGGSISPDFDGVAGYEEVLTNNSGTCDGAAYFDWTTPAATGSYTIVFTAGGEQLSVDVTIE